MIDKNALYDELLAQLPHVNRADCEKAWNYITDKFSSPDAIRVYMELLLRDLETVRNARDIVESASGVSSNNYETPVKDDRLLLHESFYDVIAEGPFMHERVLALFSMASVPPQGTESSFPRLEPNDAWIDAFITQAKELLKSGNVRNSLSDFLKEFISECSDSRYLDGRARMLREITARLLEFKLFSNEAIATILDVPVSLVKSIAAWKCPLTYPGSIESEERAAIQRENVLRMLADESFTPDRIAALLDVPVAFVNDVMTNP